MKAAALLLLGGVTMGAANAQATSEGPRVEFQPMPNTLPRLLFAPDSLAGTMLEPFTQPETATAPAVTEGAPMASSETAPAEVGSSEPMPPEVAVSEEAPPETAAEGPLTWALAQADPEPMERSEEAADAQSADDGATVAAADPAQEPAGTANAPTLVHVIVENIESSNGTVNVAVCDTGFSPEGCPYKASVPASAGFVEAMFDDVPPGVYAVVGYHDVNDNDEFDKFLGVPREPYALSGGAAEKLVPEFRDAVLNINQGENNVIIRMKRLGGG